MEKLLWGVKIGNLQAKLEEAGLIKADEKGVYHQTGSNCFEIATFLAREFGYHPPSLEEIKEAIRRSLESNKEQSSEESADAFFVVYDRNFILI
jgi:hypothetical protein